MPNLEDIAPEIRAERAKRELDQIEQYRQQAGVGSQMEGLMADAKWSIYCGHIQALAENYQAEAEGYRKKLSNDEFLEPKEYGDLKVKYAKVQGRVEALQIAISTVQTLVERGEQALEVLTSKLTRDGDGDKIRER